MYGPSKHWHLEVGGGSQGESKTGDRVGSVDLESQHRGGLTGDRVGSVHLGSQHRGEDLRQKDWEFKASLFLQSEALPGKLAFKCPFVIHPGVSH